MRYKADLFSLVILSLISVEIVSGKAYTGLSSGYQESISSGYQALMLLASYLSDYLPFSSLNYI